MSDKQGYLKELEDKYGEDFADAVHTAADWNRRDHVPTEKEVFEFFLSVAYSADFPVAPDVTQKLQASIRVRDVD